MLSMLNNIPFRINTKQRYSLQISGHTQAESKRIFHANGNQRAGVAILISDKIDYKSKTVARDKVII